MSGRRSEGRAGHRVLRKAWALPAILLSGALMLISSGPPATAGASGQQRGPSVATVQNGEHGPAAPSVAATADDVRELPVTATPATGKLGYAPPASVGTVAGLDRYLLDTVPAPAGRVPADDAWTTTDPQRGPPAVRQ